jgi:hypothetical protein
MLPYPFDDTNNQDHTLNEITVLCDLLLDDNLINKLLVRMKEFRELNQSEKDHTEIEEILYLMQGEQKYQHSTYMQ